MQKGKTLFSSSSQSYLNIGAEAITIVGVLDRSVDALRVSVHVAALDVALLVAGLGARQRRSVLIGGLVGEAVRLGLRLGLGLTGAAVAGRG